MTPSAKLATLFATGSLLLAGTPAFAASAITDAFVANVRPNVDFLDTSSRLALDNSMSPRMRRFARSEASEQTITSNSLVAWTQTNTGTGVAAALGAPLAPIGDLGAPLAPIGGLIAAPLDVATGITTGVVDGVGGVVTGRSVAIDPSGSTAGTLLPSGQNDLSRLRDLRGAAFDALYRSTQADALDQLATLYRDYIQNGDDPALRTIAVRELPKINREIAELRRV